MRLVIAGRGMNASRVRHGPCVLARSRWKTMSSSAGAWAFTIKQDNNLQRESDLDRVNADLGHGIHRHRQSTVSRRPDSTTTQRSRRRRKSWGQPCRQSSAIYARAHGQPLLFTKSWKSGFYRRCRVAILSARFSRGQRRLRFAWAAGLPSAASPATGEESGRQV